MKASSPKFDERWQDVKDQATSGRRFLQSCLRNEIAAYGVELLVINTFTW
jgi:hypothetical protein